jgi:hypothetical protein
VWRAGALVAVLLAWSVVEAVLREDLTSRPLVLAAVFVVLAPLWWRRTHPLPAVAISFGTLTAVDVARILAGEEAGLLASISGVLVLAYALFRWGAGREAATGVGVILVWMVITHVADPMSPAGTVAAFAFFCSPQPWALQSATTPTRAPATSRRPKLGSASSWRVTSTTRSPTTSPASPSRPRPDVPSQRRTPSVQGSVHSARLLP